MCDQADCQEAAVFSYTWDWGAQGKCCAKHQFLLQQTSETLQRRVNFAPLVAAAPAPLTRDERTRLKGETYALGEEISDLKQRGVQLYTENTTLTRQLQATAVRLRETEAQLKDAKGDLQSLGSKLEESDAQRGQMADELSRLRTLAKFTPPDEEETTRVE
jgi:chromosome segregation ATPase